MEVTPTFGTVNFTGVLADYRRYVMPMSFYTIATRFVSYSRLGSGGEDPRLQLDLHQRPGVDSRIPAAHSAVFRMCPDGRDGVSAGQSAGRKPGCGRKRGTAVSAAAALWRSQRMYGPLPIEVALFGDSGVAWNRGEKPAILGGSRQGISSTRRGVSSRFGLCRR